MPARHFFTSRVSLNESIGRTGEIFIHRHRGRQARQGFVALSGAHQDRRCADAHPGFNVLKGIADERNLIQGHPKAMSDVLQ